LIEIHGGRASPAKQVRDIFTRGNLPPAQFAYHFFQRGGAFERGFQAGVAKVTMP